MTESGWLECSNPKQMLAYLDGKASNRKLWLLACGCCRQHPNLMADSRCYCAVETGERYADGQVNADELMEASEEAFCRRSDLAGNQVLEAVSIAAAFSVVDPADRDSALPPITTALAVQGTSEDLILLTELCVVVLHNTAATKKARQQAADAERAVHCRLMRCVIGNPFGYVTTDASWLAWNDGIVVNLAQAIYDDRAFERIPILADALEDAGCQNAKILNHLREPGVHVLGCWVVDLLLGKE